MNKPRMDTFGIVFSLALFLCRCGGSPPNPEAPLEAVGAVNADTARQDPAYLSRIIDETGLSRFFDIEENETIDVDVVVQKLVAAGIEESDAERTLTPGYIPTPARQSELLTEFDTYDVYYFDREFSGSEEEISRAVRQIFTAQGSGYTPRQFLAYLQIAFGPGRCEGHPTGSAGCPVRVQELQDALVKGLDVIPNLRYRSTRDSKYQNVFAVHREDIAYQRVFDLVARELGGFPSGNPLRQIPLNIEDPQGPDCRWLVDQFANGRRFARYLRDRYGMPASLAKTTGRLLDGVSERSMNAETGEINTYRYGLFYLQAGENCSRLEAEEPCYDGDPALIEYLVEDRRVPFPLENGNYEWTCRNIAEVINTMVSNPSVTPASARPYAILEGTSPNDYQFPTYLPSGQPQASLQDLTAEDVLMFYVAFSNGHVNQPDAAFADNIPVSDLNALDEEASEVPDLINPEWAFQEFSFNRLFEDILERHLDF